MASGTDATRPARRRFPKALRVLSRKDFEEIREHGRSLRDAVLRVGWRERTGETRLGLAVSARVGDAPVRNRIKRVVREVFRLHRQELPNGVDLVVIPLDGVRARDFATVREALLRMGERIEQQRRAGAEAGAKFGPPPGQAVGRAPRKGPLASDAATAPRSGPDSGTRPKPPGPRKTGSEPGERRRTGDPR